MKLLPVRLEGPHVAFSASLASGEVYAETWTVTDDAGVAREARREDAERLLPEFEALAASRETAPATFLDLSTGDELGEAEATEILERARENP